MAKLWLRKQKIQQPLRLDGSEAQKPQKRNALPLDKTVFSEDALKRFWAMVDKNPRATGCWVWIGSLTHDGYGRSRLAGKQIMSHRASFRMHIGEIPEGFCVCHDCPGGDNPACVNPQHLWLGTQWDNTLDRMMKGKYATGERSGAHTHPERVPRGARHHSKINPKLCAFGEGVNTAKLVSEEVLKIRKLHATGKFSCLSLAKRFGVSGSTINQIVTNKIWRHLL